ncbi:hypothetical protein EV359DRAFT_67382 [Lentinula novae-zelandiae]|nr:hypothetical protein EV359DRAFT_67382 [Lentinula novae-zelandiae]
MYFHRIMISALGFVSVVLAAAVPGPTPLLMNPNFSRATTLSHAEDFILARPLSSRTSKLASVLFHGTDPSTPSIQADTETAVFRLLKKTLEQHPEFGHSLTREEVEFKGNVVKGNSGEYRFDVTLKDSSGTGVACRGHVIYQMVSTTSMQIQKGSAVYRVSDFKYLSKIERPYVEVLGMSCPAFEMNKDLLEEGMPHLGLSVDLETVLGGSQPEIHRFRESFNGVPVVATLYWKS